MLFYQKIIITCLAIELTCCGQRDFSSVKTDLSPDGNRDVAARFQRVKDSKIHCDKNGEGKRVLVTGFGLFDGADYNVSGVVTESMMNLEFFPNSINTYDSKISMPDKEPTDGILIEKDLGMKLTTRQLMIDGNKYNACFMLVDVQWDFAAALITEEIQHFEPSFVLMSGRGGDQPPFLEGGAFNRASPISGFNSDGSNKNNNTPVSNEILPSTIEGVSYHIPLSWDNQMLVNETRDLIGGLGYHAKAPAKGREDNDYICNNIAYVAAHAVKGVPIHLAGGEIKIDTKMLSETKVGFFHYPFDVPKKTDAIFGWARVMARIIAKTLDAGSDEAQ